MMKIVTGTKAVSGMPPTQADAHICAYSARVDWTPEEIRRRRDAKGYSQEELGQRLGEHLGKPVSRRAITNWEAGSATPHGRNLRALDLVLGDEPDAKDPPISQASFMDLIAEITRRYARAATPRGETPQELPLVRYTWSTEDAPSGRRTAAEAQDRPAGRRRTPGL